ncbi:metalloregulator ArsR/SmtB family transcription factor [Christensenellaceae bacterium OttesenSCG-928-L17]|nr:metalloregulator ArsR/SmtB family transcription factor [Christensenellaceae bacterium OttesenSCG-928-L17]
MTNFYARHINMLKALSDETRLKIVHLLTQKEMHANELLECFSIAQPSLSYHMKILSEANIVKCERRATYAIYSIDHRLTDHIREFLGMLESENHALSKRSVAEQYE